MEKNWGDTPSATFNSCANKIKNKFILDTK